ncbi:MAG: DHH family phosphoesterase [Acidobacteriota bacterium]|nr:DHH family phosphoesterase [Acidobacteriota bacterium]
MNCVAVCRDDLIVKTLHEALSPTLDITFLVEDPPQERRLRKAGIPTRVGDPHQTKTYLQTNVTADTCILVEDNGRRNIQAIVDAAAGAGTSLVYVLRVGDQKTASTTKAIAIPNVSTLSLSELTKTSLVNALSRSLTRSLVQQYQRHFEDADRVLILLHNDPDPDALASGLALRNLLRRTKTTAIIGAFHGVTRPENLRMTNLLDIKVESITAESLAQFDRIATIDVQPHYFGGLLNHVDLVIDHHPERSGEQALFKYILSEFGSTATIMTNHLRSVDANVSERVATALLYAIKSDTLFLSRHTNSSDLDAFTFLYQLADAQLVRKMEGSGVTHERLQYVTTASQTGKIRDQLFTACLGLVPREDIVTYVADFLLQVEDIKWTVIAGQIDDKIVISVRNVGYTRHAGTFVNKWFDDIGSAGGHRAIAKAIVPTGEFGKKFGTIKTDEITELLEELAVQFILEPPQKT